MSLLIVTIISIDSDISQAGSLMLNSNRIGPFQLTGTSDSIFNYYEAQHSRKTHFKRYVTDDAVATIAAAIAANNKLVYALPAYIDNNAANSTETIYINTTEIAKGVAYGSDSTKSWLWVEKTPGKVVKYLVNKGLETIKDWVNTGTTTTTSTTTTSTTSTTSTTTT